MSGSGPSLKVKVAFGSERKTLSPDSVQWLAS